MRYSLGHIQKALSIIQKIIELLSIVAFLKKKKGFEEFALALRKRESGDNYHIVNAYGYLGAYQFGMAKLCDLGYTERIPGKSGYENSSFQWREGYSKEYFLNTPDLQDRVFREHVSDLISRIKGSFSEYLGKRIGDIEITLSGCVAGAHLGGIGGLSNFLRGLMDSKDQLGTSISEYVRTFAGYNLE